MRSFCEHLCRRWPETILHLAFALATVLLVVINKDDTAQHIALAFCAAVFGLMFDRLILSWRDRA